MLPLFARAGAALVPGASRLPFLGDGRSTELPDLTLVLDPVTVPRERLAAYSRVCGFPLRDRLPSTYPHILAFPLQLALMTDSSFPFAALGLVHIANRIVQRRPLGVAEQLQIKVWAAGLQSHPRGTQFTLRSEARVADELVWEDASTYLRRGDPPEGSSRADREGAADGGSREGAAEGGSRPSPEQPPEDELPVTATWKLAGDLGRRYGSVSGDLNPIHIHPLSARLFGFPTAIAHGMWTNARCLAALDPRLPERFAVEVEFRKPILLPATVQFSELETTGGIRFGVRGAGKGTPHLDGSVSFA